MASEGEAKGRKPVGFICGTPSGIPGACSGKNCLDHGKTHPSMAEVRRCMRRFLLSAGFSQLSGREFAAPNGGPITVLNKKPSRALCGKVKNSHLSQRAKVRETVSAGK